MRKRTLSLQYMEGHNAGFAAGITEGARREQRAAFRDGVKAAASFAGEWDAQIDHPYRFEDVILCKFNLTKLKKPRCKRTKRLEGK